LSLEEIRALLEASDQIHFEGQGREEIYGWVNETLRQQKYSGLGRKGRGLAPYTRGDAELLAGVDEAHETLSGPATQKILQREFHGFGEQRYQRLARISVAYRLRKTAAYRKRLIACHPARPVQVAIGNGERRSPKGGLATSGGYGAPDSGGHGADP